MKKRTTIASALAVMMLLASCAGGSGDDSGAGAPPTVDEYASIIRTTQDWPTYTDPAVGNDQSDVITMINLYDSLVFPGVDGQPVPHLASSWESSDDGLEYVFHLRDDVKFHSGNALTAQDVVYSMKRMLAIGEGFAYLYLDVIEDVKAEDDYTVKFTLSNSFGPFVGSLIRFQIVDSVLLTQHYDMSVSSYGEAGDYGKTWLLTNDAGSGPYKAIDVKL
jgi:peptide/nickel transport system substrate-binding protein